MEAEKERAESPMCQVVRGYNAVRRRRPGEVQVLHWLVAFVERFESAPSRR